MIARAFAAGTVVVTLLASPLHGQAGPHYRDFELGGDLASVSALTGIAVSEATVIHVRPALMQDLLWRQPYASSDATVAPRDPVQEIAFSFYNDQLFRLVVDYSHDRTEGMTDGDMIEAISSAYGATTKAPLKGRVVASQIVEESGTPVAHWGGSDYSVVLYRASYASGFRLIVTSLRLEALARAADTQALRLDERDAPKREIARQKKEADDALVSQAKARLANKTGFRP